VEEDAERAAAEVLVLEVLHRRGAGCAAIWLGVGGGGGGRVGGSGLVVALRCAVIWI
jgi:hypothetical protein